MVCPALKYLAGSSILCLYDAESLDKIIYNPIKYGYHYREYILNNPRLFMYTI